jgi:hypothetical protein
VTPESAKDRLSPAEREAFERASRWATIRQRQAAHDGAVVVDAYFLGYLAGLRDEVAGAGGSAASNDERAPVDASALADERHAPTQPAVPTLPELVLRARVEGYEDGRHWREAAKLGGIVRLAAYQSGKSTRRFASEDLMRTPRRVRRVMQYQEGVEESVSAELLRRLHHIRAPEVDTGV